MNAYERKSLIKIVKDLKFLSETMEQTEDLICINCAISCLKQIEEVKDAD